MLPDGLEERFRALRRRPTLRAELRADREAAVERVTYGTAHALWIPSTPLDMRPHDAPPRAVSVPERDDKLAGLDSHGRAALARSAFGLDGEAATPLLALPSESTDTYVIHSRLLSWHASRLEVVGFLTHADVSHVSWIDHDDAGRPVTFATVGVEQNALGKCAQIAWCEWDGDRCRRVRMLRRDEQHRWTGMLATGDYDDVGLRRTHVGCTDRVAQHARAHAAIDDVTLTVRWDRDWDGWEADPLEPADALSAWVDAVADAAHRTVAAANPVAPFVIRIYPVYEHGDTPQVIVGDRAYRDAVAGRVAPREAIDQLWEPRISLVPLLREDAKRTWRSLRQQRVPATDEAAERLQRDLAARSWPGDAVPLVAGFGADQWELAERILGRQRIAKLLAGFPPRRRAPSITTPPASVAELVALLRRFDLPETIALQARWGLALTSGGRGVSRLGGRPDLPDRMSWPVSENRPLTHLATIDLSELPAVDGRAQLPADGTVVFFADFSEEAALWEPTIVGEDERVRIVALAPGCPTHRPEPPDDERDPEDTPVVLRQRKVRFRQVLTLPEEPDGLTAPERLGYAQLHEALVELTPGLNDPAHLLLGHPASIQGMAVDHGHVSVLHMGWDERLGFMFLDGGDITFHGLPEDVAAGRWDRLTVTTESC